MSSLDRTAAILAQHQRRTDTGHCWCDGWPTVDRDETWMAHVAKALHGEPKPTARQPHPLTQIGRPPSREHNDEGCCQFSATYCKSLKWHTRDQLACCDSCDH